MRWFLSGQGTFKNKGLSQTKTIIYRWEQTAGTPVELFNADTASASFVAPQPAAGEEILDFDLIVSSAIGKGKTVSDTDSVSVTVIGVASSSSISGRVTDVAGHVIPDVLVDVLLNGSSTQMASTNIAGQFALNVDDETEFVLKLTAPGYAVQSVPVLSPSADDAVALQLTMIARGDSQAFDSGAATTLSANDGASVSVAANSFVDANGDPVSGDIQVSITPVDISNPASLAAFPGEFSGVLQGDTDETPIISYGTVEYVFSQNGQPLQLAPGQSAEIIIPIYALTHQDGTPISIGDEIPLWSLNEDSGIWTQEETGIVVESLESPTGLGMLATVTHFTWWNCDVSMNAAQAIVTVLSSESGTVLLKARTTADIGWRSSTVETVVSLGVPTSPLFIPSNGEVCFSAEINYTNGSIGTTTEECVNAAPSSLVNIDLIEPVPGPLAIMTIPANTSGVLNVDGFVNFPVTPVKLRAASFETTVNYTIIAGSLPTGLSLNSVNLTSAEMTGIPTETGNFSITLQGIDADNFTDTVTINYVVSADTPPPVLQNVRINYNRNNNVFDLNQFNGGGPVTNWSLSQADSRIMLNSTTGQLTILGECVFTRGLQLTASNAGGSSTVSISISDAFCH